MRLLRTLLVVLIPSLGAFAQTNAPETRKLSLEDCVTIALEHNLDVKIKRFNPDIAGYTLAALYGNYDPAAYFDGQHDFPGAGDVCSFGAAYKQGFAPSPL